MANRPFSPTAWITVVPRSARSSPGSAPIRHDVAAASGRRMRPSATDIYSVGAGYRPFHLRPRRPTPREAINCLRSIWARLHLRYLMPLLVALFLFDSSHFSGLQSVITTCAVALACGAVTLPLVRRGCRSAGGVGAALPSCTKCPHIFPKAGQTARQRASNRGFGHTQGRHQTRWNR
jgi:hypothetical protein